MTEEPEDVSKGLELVQNGTLGFFIWECIKEQDGKFSIEIDSKLIEKGYLQLNRLYKVIFRFAENECEFLKNK